nr:hypothetical protein Iba_chr06bCG11290 [Ipomoea batatas]
MLETQSRSFSCAIWISSSIADSASSVMTSSSSVYQELLEESLRRITKATETCSSSAAPGSDDNIIYDVQPLRSIVPQNEKDVVIMNLKLHRQRLENANHEADPSSLCSSKSTLEQTAGKGNW